MLAMWIPAWKKNIIYALKKLEERLAMFGIKMTQTEDY